MKLCVFLSTLSFSFSAACRIIGALDVPCNWWTIIIAFAICALAAWGVVELVDRY